MDSANTKTDSKNADNSFADLIQEKIVRPVRERFGKQNEEIAECSERIEAIEKRLRSLEKALSELNWGE